MPVLPTAVGAGIPLRHRIGGARDAAAGDIPLGVPVLHGPPFEVVFPDAEAIGGGSGLFRLWKSSNYLIGCASAPLTGAITGELAAGGIYDNLLRLVGSEHHLCRIWNYVPGINTPCSDGMEVYQSFCRGRSLAFEAAWGREFKTRLPAASAVGSQGDELIVLFAASTGRARHFENPHQVPAYDYPCQYGPRPPSFARATVCETRPASRDVFVSGTSSVRGHESIAMGDILSQTRCTLENLRDISRACDLGDHCGLDRAEAAFVKVYLRHAGDFGAVETALRGAFSAENLNLHIVHADVCRSNLDIEIEVTARGVTHAH
ncbi:MAG: hypothetical protein ACREIA_06990 [Opitutaceae bacterium]